LISSVPVAVSVPMKYSQFLAANVWIFTRTLWLMLLWAICFGWLGYAVIDFSDARVNFNLILPFSVVIALPISIVVSTWFAYRALSTDEPTHYLFSTEGFTVMRGDATGHCGWNEIRTAVENQNFFAVALTHACYIVPLCYFPDTESVAQVRQLLAEQLGTQRFQVETFSLASRLIRPTGLLLAFSFGMLIASVGPVAAWRRHNIAMPHLEWAGWYRAANDYPSALKEINLALNFDPRYASAYNFRGLIRSQMGDELGALDDFTQALALGPGSGNLHFNRAASMRRLGMEVSAIKAELEMAERLYERHHQKQELTNVRRILQDLESEVSP